MCRSLLDSSGGTGGGIISSGDKVGWHVITPFQVLFRYDSVGTGIDLSAFNFNRSDIAKPYTVTYSAEPNIRKPDTI
jgi:hypothetical protein